ncbi:MAG: 7-carboxy-7-deazaguanine synthase QueE [Dysgonamonadaceae bacterium]|jgi:organic radical activating enzyme|nr:7-carboxy-7-deazaguanine synthase QueE [Dysgonamonadaceae bacterium]
MNLNVKEIFYSLQGEGGRQGEASIFIRLTGCNLSCDFCDTDFESGSNRSVEQILSSIRRFPCRWIVWTGGEPTLQLTDEILLFFKEAGFRQAIESNGYKQLSTLLNYTVVSPKGKKTYAKAINPRVDEVRLPVQEGDPIPPLEMLPEAHFFFLSPVFTGNEVSTKANIDYCVEQIKRFPCWRLSLQIHKLIGIE